MIMTGMKKTLFIIKDYNNEDEGKLIFNNDKWLIVYVVSTITIILGFIFLILFGEYSEKSHVSGYLIPDKGLIKVTAIHQGIISRVNVVEGQHVLKNELLFVIDLNSISDQGKTSDLISDSLKKRHNLLVNELSRLHLIHLSQTEMIEKSISSLSQQKVALEKEIQAENIYLSLSERNLKRYSALGKNNAISQSDIEKAQQYFQAAIIQLNSMKRVLASTDGNLEQNIQERKSLIDKQNNEDSQLQRSIEEIEQEMIKISQQQYLNLTASSDGTVTQITGKLGGEADTAIPLATILPDGANLEADMYVPSISVGFVKKGNEVLLAYQAYPYQKFGLQHAVVFEIDKTAVNPKELPFSPTSQDPMYLVKARLDKPVITIYGKDEQLQSGEKFDAYLILEHRKIWEWAIDPLIAEKEKF